ncbi:MAG: type IX secretion system membrane protein PorP/SprF [Flavobacteriales bacterium]|nr:type IX secretion system membrane protein PorP/SprF [Flavobacteriales bacterium]
MKNHTSKPRPATRWQGALVALLLAGTALAPQQAAAQQDPQFSQYMFNLLALNPAYAGSAERLSVKALSRHQWVGLEGAPTTQTLTAHAPVFKQALGLGGTLMRDEHGPVTQYGFIVDVAYRMFLGKDQKLAFGLKGGMNLFQGDFASLHQFEANDQVFQQNVTSKTDPQFGFGVMYYGDRFYLGISSPKLLRTQFFETDSLQFVSEPGQRMHLYLSGGYVFNLSTYTKLKPTFMVKAVEGAPVSIDLGANFLLYEKLWLGAFYRYTDAVGALVQYNITDAFTVGYSYDYPLSALHNYSGGSHEFMLGYEFGKAPAGIRSPRYF